MKLVFEKILFPIGTSDRLHVGSEWIVHSGAEQYEQLKNLKSFTVKRNYDDEITFTCDAGRMWSIRGELQMELEHVPSTQYNPTWLLHSHVTDVHDPSTGSVLRRLYDDPTIHTMVYVDYIRGIYSRIGTEKYSRLFDIFRRQNRVLPSSVLSAMNHLLRGEHDAPWVAYIDGPDELAETIILDDEYHATLLRLQHGDKMYEIDFRDSIL